MVNGHVRAKRVALLIEQNVEDVEFQIPYNALIKAGATVVVLGSRMNEEYKGKQGKLSIRADGTTTEALATEFDAVVIPGGMAPDRMRVNPKTVRFVQQAIAQGKLVAAVCHGPQVLIEGDLVRGKQVTGFLSIRKDLQNAGAEYRDDPLVIDGNMITARRPGDLPVWTTAILHRLNLTIPDTTLPDEQDTEAGWWKLGEEWGGSSKWEIGQAINTAIAGERYALEAFGHYLNRVTDSEVAHLFRLIIDSKKRHIQRLESRLKLLGEPESFQAVTSGAYAMLKSWLQSTSNELEVIRRALGDLQTGVVDTYHLRNQLTDPATVALLDDLEIHLSHDEQRLADLYHGRSQPGAIQPPQPTSQPAVSG